MKKGDPFGLEDLALETGSSLEFADGRKFNSAGLQTSRKVREPVAVSAPAPAPAPPPAPAPDLTPLLQQLIAAVNRPVEVTIPPMPAPQITVQAAEQKASPPQAWTFDFERNANGTIKRINATVKE